MNELDAAASGQVSEGSGSVTGIDINEDMLRVARRAPNRWRGTSDRPKVCRFPTTPLTAW